MTVVGKEVEGFAFQLAQPHRKEYSGRCEGKADNAARNSSTFTVITR